MEDFRSLSDAELLSRLRSEYLQALQLKDFGHINTVIEPQFWSRFGRYYEAYTRAWRETPFAELSVRVVIDPGQWKRMELQWMDQVLRGQIELRL